MLLEKPRYTVFAAGLLVGRKRNDDVSPWHVALLLHSQQARENGGQRALHVDRAAAVQPTIALNELEGVRGPVFAPSINDIEVSDVQDGTGAGPAAQPNHNTSLVRAATRGDDDNVALREPGSTGSCRDGLRRSSRTMVGGGIDANQLGQDVATECFNRRRRTRRS